MMRKRKLLMLLGLIFLVGACATTRETIPSGRLLQCPDGKRPLMDCSMAFQQYQRVLKFDVNAVGSFGTGIGIGAQSLITLDSITGDLLAHQQQVCIEYNNCMITQAEYLAEQKYLRRAQLKIREMANTTKIGIDNPLPTPPPLSLPTESSSPLVENTNPTVNVDEKINKVQDGQTANLDLNLNVSNPVIINELNSLEKQVQALVDQKGLQIKTENTLAPLVEETKTVKKVGLEYSLMARREKPSRPGEARKNYEPIQFFPGTTLNSGDQFKINFKTDSDGYVYVVNFDSSGKARILFPHPEAGSNNQAKAGRTYEIPASPDTWYYLDDVKGEEILYVVALPFPLPNLDSLVADLKQGKGGVQTGIQTARLRGSLEALTRGIGVSTDDKNAKDPNPKKSVMTTERIEFNHN